MAERKEMVGTEDGRFVGINVESDTISRGGASNSVRRQNWQTYSPTAALTAV